MEEIMNRIELPSGGWVEHVDVDTLITKHRKFVLAQGDKAEGDVMKTVAYQDALLAVSITAWSFEFPIPWIKKDSVDLLPPKDYAFLLKGLAKEADTALFPEVEDKDDPKA